MSVWLDETGSDNRDTRKKFGYAVRGHTPRCHRLLVRGRRVSAIVAISTDGLVAAEYHYGTINADIFYDYAQGYI